MRDVDCDWPIKDHAGALQRDKSGASFLTWRQQRVEKLHFCSLHIVSGKWNNRNIGEAANNEGLCPGNP